MRAAILFKSGVGTQVARLFAVKTWRDAIAPGAAVEYFDNTGDTQTFAAIGFPMGYFKNAITEQPSKKLDLHSMQEFCLGANFEAVDLENDSTFKAVFAKELEKGNKKSGSTPKNSL